MTSVIELYEQIDSAPDEKTRARLIMEALRHIERRLPAVHNLDTHAALRAPTVRLVVASVLYPLKFRGGGSRTSHLWHTIWHISSAVREGPS